MYLFYKSYLPGLQANFFSPLSQKTIFTILKSNCFFYLFIFFVIINSC